MQHVVSLLFQYHFHFSLPREKFFLGQARNFPWAGSDSYLVHQILTSSDICKDIVIFFPSSLI